MTDPKTPNDLLHDPRPISSIHWGSEDECFAVGLGGCTKIEVYGEPAMHCDIPWFRIWVGDQLVGRRDAFGCSVFYEIKPEAAP